jgi:hypothetical protein
MKKWWGIFIPDRGKILPESKLGPLGDSSKREKTWQVLWLY